MSRPVLTALLAAAVLAATLVAAPGSAFEPLWLRYPAISPDGGTVVFCYRGDLYRVSADGGLAVPLTVNEAYDFKPVWSPDGSAIAFASDRHGSFDVFVMPASGGAPRRLTTSSATDLPSDFSPDGRHVLFSSGRVDAAPSALFPSGSVLPELYRVPVAGGRTEMVLTTPALDARWDATGTRLAYTDVKGMEDDWRKHQDSAFTRDVWLYDAASGGHERLTGLGTDDRQPVWGPQQRWLYFLSERSGSFNVWRLDLERREAVEQVTAHQTHPVRFLSASRNGDLCYAFDGGLWVRRAGARDSVRLAVELAADDRRQTERLARAAEDVTEMALSPTGKEVAVVIRGEVFVASTEHPVTRRITTTPEQERSVSFSRDGRALLYAGERGGSWNLYQTRLVRDDEPYFWNATLLEEKPVLEGPAETFQPSFSPDGTEVAYLEERTTLKVVTLATGATRVVLPGDRNYSYIDGDQWYQWSPDGRSFVVTYLSPKRWSAEVGLVDAQGAGPLTNLSRSGYEDSRPRFVGNGEVVLWTSDRNGLRSHGGWQSEEDVFALFLTRAAWDRFNLTQAELELVQEAEGRPDDKGKGGGDGDGDKPKRFEPKPIPDPVAIELDGLEDRVARLTTHASRLADAVLTPDREQLLYLARFEKGYDLWRSNRRKGEVKLLLKLDADEAGDLQVSADGKHVYLLADNKVIRVAVESGERKDVALAGTLELDPVAERAHLFEHCWRQVAKKFYVEDLHGVDWQGLKQAYARFLPHVDSGWDFAELLSEMLGELNASHTGATYRPKRDGAEETAWLGALLDPAHLGAGLKVVEVVDGGPLRRAGSKVAAGTVIEAVDGQAIAAGADPDPLLEHKAGRPVLLDLLDPASGSRWQETVKPIAPAAARELLYQRWVRARRADVERLSGGRLGYVHVRGMNDRSFRDVFADILGRFSDREGLVVDTRYNGGGNLAEQLTTFLSGRLYAHSVPRGQVVGEEPWFRWNRPSVVVMNEGNYSDAHIFPWAYKELGIGKLVGSPVPGTGTSVWWETLQDPTLTFGIPEVGFRTLRGDFLENQQLEPDVYVDNDPALVAQGRDQQLERAVEVLLGEIDAAAGSRPPR